MTMIKIWLNDQPVVCEAEQTLSQFVAQLSLPTQGTAMAINQSIVAASEWSTTVIADGDQLALFQAIAGG
ncbi:thiamine biosynthesis protein ThiS [Photobacterium kishitanii]|uniref:Thiamine biosynthesis protein ThiS n=2 Tax=Photobacterium kishitanii TaxID=318456 RepID=A0A0B7JFF5_9GAMM|nr:sulfur carrier protein ThiS [Photobacterium kishitanii]OBU27542.1 thiamine biosynthesis protein ThiS [Photobacterium kishitanii]OBU31059.1 thiamine biosynthesis protein ThiS [Photobacterium kishitanii]PSU20182.1 thiamine biosynthesis protein ThiS [Photobacterium kishitanii]PSU90901.1 thiamine biosynthesis protein ThiS [Photobacterium kishitanii]PSU92487.1 thiamine biosynthesis protein ThiS [Photobacterium kishitanii]